MTQTCIVYMALLSIASTHTMASAMKSMYFARAAGATASVQDTVQALDTNGNGKVDKDEITAFAQSQGLSTQEVLADFKQLDANGDGELDAVEIGGLLAAPEDAQGHAEAKSAVVTKPVPATAVSAPQEVQPMATAASSPVTSAQPDAAVLPSLDIDALDAHAKQQAGGVVARNLAQRAQLLLSRSRADRQKALEFEAKAHELRANATELAERIGEQTQRSASVATKTMAQKSVDDVKQLQETMTASLAAAKEHSDRARQALASVQEVWSTLPSSDRAQ